MDPDFPAAEQDRYDREYAEVARRLGAPGVPASGAEVADYLRSSRLSLRYDHWTRAVAAVLAAQPAPSLAAAAAMAAAFDAAKDLLPDWAATRHGFRLPHPGERPHARR